MNLDGDMVRIVFLIIASLCTSLPNPKWVFAKFTTNHETPARAGIMIIRPLNGNPLRFMILGPLALEDYLGETAEKIMELN